MVNLFQNSPSPATKQLPPPVSDTSYPDDALRQPFAKFIRRKHLYICYDDAINDSKLSSMTKDLQVHRKSNIAKITIESKGTTREFYYQNKLPHIRKTSRLITPSLKGIRSMNINSKRLNVDTLDLTYFSKALRRRQKMLNELSFFTNSSKKDIVPIQVFEFMKWIKPNYGNLKHLKVNIPHIHLEEDFINELSGFLNGDYLRSLKYLELTCPLPSNDINESINGFPLAKISKILKPEWPKLERLELSIPFVVSTKEEIDTFHIILSEGKPILKYLKLDIFGNDSHNDETITGFSKMMQDRFKILRSLDLGTVWHQTLTATAVKTIGNMLNTPECNIDHFGIGFKGNQKITDATIKSFLDLLPSTLPSLHIELKDCEKLTSKSLLHISDAISKHFSNLKALSIDTNITKDLSKGLELLNKGLKSDNVNLTSFSLACRHIRKFPERTLSDLCDALSKSSSTLTHLSVSLVSTVYDGFFKLQAIASFIEQISTKLSKIKDLELDFLRYGVIEKELPKLITEMASHLLDLRSLKLCPSAYGLCLPKETLVFVKEKYPNLNFMISDFDVLVL